MVYPHEWLLQSASVFWIFTLLLSESHSKQSQIFYMEAKDCGNKKPLGGAVVYSHSQESGDNYLHDISCQITFQAKDDHWRLMLRVIELDIPDRTPNGYCNDALYVFDDSTSYTVAMKDAGGIGGLCGSILPPTLKSTGRYMTVVFRTGAEGPVGRGFKYIITAFNEDYEKQGTCGSDF
ncbi:cubilin, partial [Aplysia californica]|uniref:Cubilin n=1 Tax=Aplysia californica TaxID=6500 RepID=A0ABM1ACG6_APLCA